MVFVSQNADRKCKWCNRPAKLNMSSGRNKGYYRTCGTEDCLKRQYSDNHISVSKGLMKNPIDCICLVCGNSFKRIYNNHTRYCLECVPEKKWRARAHRYLVGKKQWDEWLIKQNNMCALCNRNPETVDHCHETQTVRGLLCSSCNTNIGKIDKDREWIKRALLYLGVEDVSFS